VYSRKLSPVGLCTKKIVLPERELRALDLGRAADQEEGQGAQILGEGLAPGPTQWGRLLRRRSTVVYFSAPPPPQTAHQKKGRGSE
jgi:hypothetical protein